MSLTKKVLETKGYVWDENQKCYISPHQLEIQGILANPYPLKQYKTVNKSVVGRPAMHQLPVGDAIFEDGNVCRITLSGLPPGLNGSKGLMRMHWANRNKMNKSFESRIKALNPTMLGMDKVSIVFMRHCLRLMDWDNACASFKPIGDAIVAAKILTDDSSVVITEFVPKQTRVKKKEEHVEIIITKL